MRTTRCSARATAPKGADAAALVAAAQSSLTAAGAHDEALAALATRLSEIGYLLTDVAGDLASYATGIDVDPARLSAVRDRRAVLTRLIRKYGDESGTVAEVLAWSQKAAERVTTLDTDDDRISALTAHRVELVATAHRYGSDGVRSPGRGSGPVRRCRVRRAARRWPCRMRTCRSR